ncbi:septum formation initiator family protein [Flavobacteriaceae bacterium]|nr:septum formation initiator family protein [Flavobacteriaceae bacterium]MDB4131276.1 septum formation initiator family protein [Flavobacteriaceae bacterium]MDC1417162.1 septum formation initiator family protein [Flavobacteriaceae bacterium]
MNSFKSFVSKIKSNKYFKFFTNFYIVVSLFFIIWMLFIDTNSYLFHKTLSSEIDQLIIKKEKLKKEILNDQKLINDLKDPDNYEAFARENFFMKKKDEEIFIIEFKDSIEN